MIADKKIDRNKLPYPVKKDRQLDSQEEYDDTRLPFSKDYHEQPVYVVKKPRIKQITYVIQDLPLY